jgi:Spy/CpxP family protein refolding chaperone
MKLFCLMILAAAIPAVGQNMHPGGAFNWWDSPVVKDLNLSPEQMQKVQSTVHDSRSRLIDLHAAVQKAELDVEDAFNAENFDLKRASDAVDRLSAARAETGKSLAQLSLNLRAVLTTEQWKELQKRRPGMMRGMGPGNMRPGMQPGAPMGRGMRTGPGMRRQNQNGAPPPPADNGNTPPAPPSEN